MKTISIRKSFALFASFALASGFASAECSQKARALDKCPPPPHVMPKSKFTGHVAGTTPFATNKPQPVTKMRKTGPLPGPSPIEHSDKNALNPQPIPPGHPVHALPPLGEPHQGGGH